MSDQGVTFPLSVKRVALETVVIHFAGDSGDGMQVMGMQLTQSCAALGNDVRTFSDFPAEIRAPAGTLPGVSGFQLSFSECHIHTPGDRYDVLVAMNPAALKVSLPGLVSGGILIVDDDKFVEKELQKAGFDTNPLDNAGQYRVIRLPMTTLTLKTLASFRLSRSAARKCKNMFALGVVYWLYHRPLKDPKAWIKERFKANQLIADANDKVLQAGYNYAITAELFAEHYTVKAAPLPKGVYRQVTGNQALVWGCLLAATQAKKTLLISGYPITPASDILQLLAQYSQFGIKTFQAEDEIAAIGAAIGAAFGGGLALTTTSGPGLDLKSEGLGLAVMAELPLVVVDVQRAGPSTGMPTKVEQSDLLAAMYGRHGECPLPVLAAASPGDCFNMIIEAFRLAIKYMTPVVLLSDAYLANSAEPWQIPSMADFPSLDCNPGKKETPFLPYKRDVNLSRPWVVPGTLGKAHRLGGLEKQHETGNISYDPDNHQLMVTMRAAKIAKISDAPSLERCGNAKGQVLVVGWGSTYGAIRTAVTQLQRQGYAISAVHLRCLNPLPEMLGELLKGFEQIQVVELNKGQLCQLLRARFLVDAKEINKVTGKPFNVSELKAQLENCFKVI